MELLSFLLLAAGWFAAALVIPQETSTVGTVVARTPTDNLGINTPTRTSEPPSETVRNITSLSSQTALCSSDTMHSDTACQVTETIHSRPMETALARNKKRVNNDRGPPGSDNRCIFAKVKVPSANGHASWKTSDDRDSSQHDCNEYCATHSMKTEDEIKSASCFKNDGKPWTDETGVLQIQPNLQDTDEAPLGTVIYGVGKCVCDWALLDDFVEDFVTKALPAVGEVSCRRKRSIRIRRHAGLEYKIFALRIIVG
jgi:hypothetical protein